MKWSWCFCVCFKSHKDTLGSGERKISLTCQTLGALLFSYSRNKTLWKNWSATSKVQPIVRAYNWVTTNSSAKRRSRPRASLFEISLRKIFGVFRRGRDTYAAQSSIILRQPETGDFSYKWTLALEHLSSSAFAHCIRKCQGHAAKILDRYLFAWEPIRAQQLPMIEVGTFANCGTCTLLLVH